MISASRRENRSGSGRRPGLANLNQGRQPERRYKNPAGENDKILSLPIFPVLPSTVIVKIPPRIGGVGPATITSILFAAADIDSQTSVNTNVELESKTPVVGSPS